MQATLNYDTLGELDGGAARAAIDAAIREAALDIDDRGDDGKPRKVEIVVTLTQMDNGRVVAHVEAAAKVPRRRTATTVLSIQRRSGAPAPDLAFQLYAPDDPTQRTLDEADPNPKKE